MGAGIASAADAAGLVAEELMHDTTIYADTILEILQIRIWEGEATASKLALMGIIDASRLSISLHFECADHNSMKR